jgi:hypothetical protein
LISDNLSRYHTIAITDLSRLSRSQLTFAELSEKFALAHTDVIGLVESLDWMNDRERRGDVGNQIQAFLLPMVAEHKVRETMLGVFRAIALKLDTNQPHAKIPSWLKRNKDGTATWGDPQRVDAIREMVRLYREEKMGFGSICNALTEKGYRTEHGLTYSRANISFTLKSRSLCGQQVMFGRPWNVFPALMSEVEFEAMQKERYQRSIPTGFLSGRGAPPRAYYLLAERLRCPCGSAMTHRPGGNRRGKDQYWSCRADKGRRITMEYQGVHPTLLASEIECFVEELMSGHRHLLIDHPHAARQQEKTTRDLQEAEERLRTAQSTYNARRRTATEEAEMQAKREGINEDNKYFVGYVKMRVAALTDSLEEEVNALTERVSTLREQLGQLVGDQQRGGRDGHTSSWDSLTAREKNELIKATFRMIWFRGAPPNEYLEMELVNAPIGALPPVPIRAKKTGGSGYTRKLPTVQEWLEGAFAP